MLCTRGFESHPRRDLFTFDIYVGFTLPQAQKEEGITERRRYVQLRCAVSVRIMPSPDSEMNISSKQDEIKSFLPAPGIEPGPAG